MTRITLDGHFTHHKYEGYKHFILHTIRNTNISHNVQRKIRTFHTMYNKGTNMSHNVQQKIRTFHTSHNESYQNSHTQQELLTNLTPNDERYGHFIHHTRHIL